jgi:hypothetical protein
MTLLLPKAAKYIELQKGAEVADVAVVVDRGTANVDTQRLAIGGQEIFDSISESVEETDGHPGWGLPDPHGNFSSVQRPPAVSRSANG